MKTLLASLCLLLWSALPAFAQQGVTGAAGGAVSVTSSSAGTQIDDDIRTGITVTLITSAASAIWVARLDGTCSTDMTALFGARIVPGGWAEFLVSDGWHGQLCAILETGSTAVSAKINTW